MKRLCLSALVCLVAIAVSSNHAFAQYTSTNYQSNEVFFGSGGDNNQSSTNYKASASAGALGVGTGSSSNYQVYSGFLTPNEPFLEMQIDSGAVNLGTLDTATTRTGTATFHVRAYVDSGYSVQSVSQPPTETSAPTSHTLANMATQSGSTIGVEQFGINLKANTSPATFGANPSPQPSSTFATGIAASGYDTSNLYKYVPGDTIAQSNGSGWGLTNFTISFIANIALTTPPGSYSVIDDLVVVATY